MNRCHMIDLGLIGYAEAWSLQKRIVAARKADAIKDVLLVCEHPHVITQGRNGKREHLLASEHVLRQKGVEYYETSRGGDITYHGPGQLVGYPILNLGAIRRDVVWYVRMLEEAMIRATSEFGITAERVDSKFRGRPNHRFFQHPHIPNDVPPDRAQIQDRVSNKLAWPVIGDVPAAAGLVVFHAFLPQHMF